MKKTLLTLTVSLLCASSWAQISGSYGGDYFEVVSDPNVPWLTAEQLALNTYYTPSAGSPLEGHLVTILNAGEDAFVGTVVQNAGLGEVWAGGYQNPVTETIPTAGWTWVNNEGTFPGFNGATSGYDNLYANWNGGEPNDAYGSASEQYLGLNYGAPGGFNDEGDLNYIDGYVVEFDPATVPGGGLAPGYVPDAGSTAALLVGALAAMQVWRRKLSA